jgi:amino acid adenylation domain-containing protein
MGWRIHALTLDNGYISDGAKANIARTVADLGISHEFVTTEAMAEIFRDSLDRYANVCNGCYKTIYTLAVARAHELGIPVIVTGLSRGQFFETRLVPHQFEAGRFDPDAIDRTVLQARRAYHHTSDAVTELLPEQSVFQRDDLDVLDEIEFVDFYRYTDVELADMYEFLAERAPWVRPADTGRSTNCLINVVGIHVHRTERGYHNYAEPYSWDVRLGHKTRDEALDELDDEVDVDEIARILDEIGYEPKRPEVLTAWYRTADGNEIDDRILAAHLRDRLPARSIPSAFVHVTDIPLAGSAKLDVGSLPAPGRRHTGSASYEPPATPTEAICADLWAQVLDVDRVGVDDDFFDLGGASLSALETVVAAERRFGVDLPDALVFDHRRLREFAAAVDAAIDVGAITVEIPPLADGPAPLTPGEEAMLFEHRAAPADPRYHGTRRYRIASTVDPERLRRAFETVVERHQPLHTAFDTERTVLPTARALSFVVVDAGTLDEHAVELARVPFDLAHGPLVRVHVENGPSGTDVLVGLHHITADAGTFDLLWNEIDVAYHGGELPDLRVTAAAHGAWQRERGDGHLPFWREYLERIPTDHAAIPAPPHPDEDGYVEVAAPVSAGELAAASVGTPFAASLAAAAVVLGGYGFDDEVALTVAASTKDHPDVEPLIGYFLNTLPVTVTAAPASTLRDVDRAASAAVSEVLPHRSLQLGEIVGDTRRRGGAVPPLSWMLAYERLAPARFGGSDVGLEVVHAGGAVNDLTFLVYEHGDDLRLAVEHRGSAISSELAHELLTAFARILEALCRRPHLTVDEVRGIGDGNDLVGPALPEHPGTVVDAIVEVASRGPDAAAVVDAAGGVTTYGELVGRARAIASALAEAAPDAQRVGVSVHRSRSVVEAIVGVHLAGAAYVPLDPTMPAERRAAITADAELDAVVADPTTAPWFDGLPVVDPHVAASRPTGGGSPAGLRRAEPDDPAYVVFTSGSTGRPAGVEITHANLAASTAARSEFYGDVPSRFLLTPSIGFDSSMVGLFWPLTTGGTVVVPGDDDVHDVDRLGAVISERDVTHVLMVPSLYRALLGRRAELLGELVTAIVAGEACDAALVAQHHRLLPAATLVNEYGPTEATVWATAHRCANGEDPVPIGRPIAGSRLRVADRHQRPVARGAVGELLISGAGVSRHGYRSGRSNAAFVDDGEHRWYRTGDLVRVDHAGRLLFVGRVDDQLNVGGVRLEPAELESHLLRIPGVDDAVVVAAPLDGRDSIVAHLVGDPDRVSVGVVREQLAEVVAASALPRHVEFHVELPRTSHGKLDRRRAAALPIRRGEPRAADAEIDGLVQIWRRALGRPELGPDDDFFASGGDSIAAVEVVTAIGDLIGHDVPVASLLSASTPAAMAARLDLAAPAPRRGAEVRFVTMRRGRPDGPAVVMTAAWDAVHAYRALADRFPDDVTVVAVALEDPNDEPTPLHEVPPFVDAAIEPISDWWRTRSGGPLVVLGWSIGGIVAQHLGEQLARTGIPVTSIALVDTFFPGEDKKLWANRWDKYRRMLRPGRLRAGGREFAHLFKRRLQRYAAALGRRLLRWSGQPVESPAVRKTRAGIPIAALDHEPTPTGVPIVVFAASMTNPNRTYRRWRDVARELRVVPIEGRHRGFESVMGADRVHQIADHLVATDLAAP